MTPTPAEPSENEWNKIRLLIDTILESFQETEVGKRAAKAALKMGHYNSAVL